MKKAYLLGLPLFHLLFGIAIRIDLLIYRAEAQNNPNMAPITVSLFLYILLLYGGFVLLAMAYGGYLFSKWPGTPKNVVCYSLLTFVIASAAESIQTPTGGWFKSMFWVLPSCEQALGFSIGALIAYKFHRQNGEQRR